MRLLQAFADEKVLFRDAFQCTPFSHRPAEQMHAVQEFFDNAIEYSDATTHECKCRSYKVTAALSDPIVVSRNSNNNEIIIIIFISIKTTRSTNMIIHEHLSRRTGNNRFSAVGCQTAAPECDF